LNQAKDIVVFFNIATGATENLTEKLNVKTATMIAIKIDQSVINPIATTKRAVLIAIQPILRHKTEPKKRNDLIHRKTRKENDPKEKKFLLLKKNLNMTT